MYFFIFIFFIFFLLSASSYLIFFPLLVALILFRTENISAKTRVENSYSPCPLSQQRPTSTNGGRHTIQHSNECTGRVRQAGEAQAQRSEAGQTGIGQDAELLPRGGGAESARGQTGAYGVQFDDCVHLPDAALRVHVDDDVTCGAREGVGGNAG